MVKREADGALVTSALWAARRVGLLGPAEVFSTEDWRTKAVFALMQLAITVATLALSKRMYDDQRLHAAFLGFIFLAAVWNGASFYLRDPAAESPKAARGGVVNGTGAAVAAPPPASVTATNPALK